MSQASHRIYKELVPLKKKYKYYKNSGRGGIRYDIYKSMIIRYKYDYLKKKLEYLLVDKRDGYEERLSFMGNWGYLKESEQLIENKLKNDTELIILNRTVRILKILLLKQGYNKIYL